MQRTVTYCLMLLFPVIWLNNLHAQQHDTAVNVAGIIQDDRVDILVKKHIQINQVQTTTDGFRIQVFSDSGINSKNRAQTVHDEFQARFPDKRVSLTFKSPNYKVRIGDFRTKLDAQRFLIELTGDYPNAFIIEDQVNLSTTD